MEWHTINKKNGHQGIDNLGHTYHAWGFWLGPLDRLYKKLGGAMLWENLDKTWQFLLTASSYDQHIIQWHTTNGSTPWKHK